jgi:signal transduction histidine kinase
MGALPRVSAIRVLGRGKEGHFGLRGMRERADRIGATLSVTSAPRKGTEITVTVPGRAIFRKGSTRLASRVRSIFSQGHVRKSQRSGST